MRGAKLYMEGGAELVYELRALLELEGYPIAATYEEADGILCHTHSIPDGEKPCLAVGEDVDYASVLAFAENLSAALWEERQAQAEQSANRPLRPTLNAVRRTVRAGGRSATLTEREFALFARLYEAKGTPVAREKLHRALWPEGTSVKEVDVYVCYLREKLTPVLGPAHIRAVRGVGYKYEE